MSQYKAKRHGSSGRSKTELGGRAEAVRVRSARGRKISSTRWLQRQLNDPFVQAAREQGLRGRAAFKLTGLDDRFSLLKPGIRLVDLGSAPGSWCQIASARCKAQTHPNTRIVGIDIQDIEPIPGVSFVHGDVNDPQAMVRVKELLEGDADLVMSDMAAASTGHHATDHLRIMSLIEIALDFSDDVLKPGGTFVTKILQGGAQSDVQKRLKNSFEIVKLAKPEASRADSTETFFGRQGVQSTLLSTKQQIGALPNESALVVDR